MIIIIDFSEDKFKKVAMSSPTTVVLEIVTAVIIVVGLTGNLIVCFLIAKNKKLRTSFNHLLLNLAVSDLLCTILGSLFFAGQLRNRYFKDGNMIRNDFERIACKIGTTSIAFTAINSILTLAAISTDRFYAIVHPWRHRRAITTRKIYVVLLVIWLIAAITIIPIALVMTKAPKTNEGETTVHVALCLLHLMDENSYKSVAFVDLMAAYVIPMAIISRNSLAIIKHLWCECSCRGERRQVEWGQSLLRSRKRITRIILSVIVAFNIFWLPWAILQGSLLIGAVQQISDTTFTVMFTLVLASASVNPILYSLQSRQFRKAVKKTFC